MDRSVPHPSPSIGSWPVWAVRGGWLALPFVAGPVLGDALDGSSRSVQVVASLGLWGVWAGVLVATLVPRSLSLTVVRVAAPAAAAAVVVASAAGEGDVAWRVTALTWALLTVAVVFAPAVGEQFVDGSSYGDERRFPLRVPGPLMAGPVPLAWVAVVAGVSAGPLLLAARQWLVGGLALVVGVAAAAWGARTLHVLARRWLVLVPGGIVLHDPLALTDPVLFRRKTLRSLGPAPADSKGLDLTRNALGLALEAQLVEPVTLVLAPGRPGGASATVQTDTVLFTPTRPGALLAAVRARGIGCPSRTVRSPKD
jgi:hypothetical protein